MSPSFRDLEMSEWEAFIDKIAVLRSAARRLPAENRTAILERIDELEQTVKVATGFS